MCQLTCDTNDFWREVFAEHSAPLQFQGFKWPRPQQEQAAKEVQARRIADASVRELRASEANDKTIFAAFENMPANVYLRRPHLRAAIADAYRAGDHAELGRIVAAELRAELQDNARDAAEDELDEVTP